MLKNDCLITSLTSKHYDIQIALSKVNILFNDIMNKYKYVNVVGHNILLNNNGEYEVALTFVYDSMEKYEDIAD